MLPLLTMKIFDIVSLEKSLYREGNITPDIILVQETICTDTS